MGPTSIAQVTNLAVYGFIDERSFHIYGLFLHELDCFLVHSLVQILRLQVIRLQFTTQQFLLSTSNLSSESDVLLNFVSKISLKFENILRLSLVPRILLLVIFEIRVVETIIFFFKGHVW